MSLFYIENGSKIYFKYGVRTVVGSKIYLATYKRIKNSWLFRGSWLIIIFNAVSRIVKKTFLSNLWLLDRDIDPKH